MLFTAVVVFLGLIVGLVIRKYTKEELKEGKKYFILIKRLLVLVISGVFLYSLQVRIYAIILALFIVSSLMFKLKIPLFAYYISFGILFLFSPEKVNLAGLMFLFGLPSAALLTKDNLKKELYLSLLFFIPVILGFLF